MVLVEAIAAKGGVDADLGRPSTIAENIWMTPPALLP